MSVLAAATAQATPAPLVVSLSNHEREVVAPLALRQAQGEREGRRYILDEFVWHFRVLRAASVPHPVLLRIN